MSQLFPPTSPTSLTDPAEITRNDWTAFSSLDRLVNHWERPAWPDGAQAYYWILPLSNATELRTRAHSCQERLASLPDLDLVPGEFLHLTLYRVGPVTIELNQLAAIADAAEKRLASTDPIDLRVGPLAGSTGAIRYTVTPWDQLSGIRNELVSATRSVLGETSDIGWRPHISIAYNAQSRMASLLIDQVRQLREQPMIQIRINEIELVKLTRIGRSYKWTAIRQLNLDTRSHEV